MYVHVIPFHNSFGVEPLTYLLPENLKKSVIVGSLVCVPYRSQEDIALVVGVSSQDNGVPTDTLKQVIRLDCSVPLLTPQEIGLLAHIVTHYCIPLHKALRLLIPIPVMTRYEKSSYLDAIPSSWKENKQPQWKYIHAHDDVSIKDTVTEIASKESCICITPHGLMLSQIEKLGGYDWIVDSPDLTPTKQYKVYHQIAAHGSDHVIGTRKSLLRRIGSYDHIIYLHDGLVPNIAQYQYQLDALWIARYIHAHGKNLSVITQVPRVVNMFEHIQKSRR